MGSWLAGIAVSLITKLGSWLLAKALVYFQGKEQKAATEKDIDQRLEIVKQAYKEAFDGNKVTPEQRKNLNAAIHDFIAGPGDGGL